MKEEKRPAKCSHCGSERLFETDHKHDGQGIVEFIVRCKSCGRDVAYFYFGRWEFVQIVIEGQR